MKLRIKAHKESTPEYGVYKRFLVIEKRVRWFPRSKWEPLLHYDKFIMFGRWMDAKRFIEIYNSLKRRRMK